MLTQNVLETEGPRRWFLDAPEANVLSRARERELLLELTDCKERILKTTRRPDGSEWGLSIPDTEFQRVVHDLASALTDLEPSLAAVGTLARRYEEIRTALAMANSPPGGPHRQTLRRSGDFRRRPDPGGVLRLAGGHRPLRYGQHDTPGHLCGLLDQPGDATCHRRRRVPGPLEPETAPAISPGHAEIPGLVSRLFHRSRSR